MFKSSSLSSKVLTLLLIAAVAGSPLSQTFAHSTEQFDSAAQETVELMNQRLEESNGEKLMLKSNQSAAALPGSIEDTQGLFLEACGSRGVDKMFRSEKLEGNQELLTFTCRSVFSLSGQTVTTFNFKTSEGRSRIDDIQVLRFDAKYVDTPNMSAPRQSMRSKIPFSQRNKKEMRQVVLAVGVSSLASGAFARSAYSGQKDKQRHAVLGSFIASAGSIVAYYGFDLNENQSAFVGFGLAVLAGALKEAYDSKNRDKHTVDSRDFWATAAGGAFGAIALRVTFKF